jgi:hypothetical protein
MFDTYSTISVVVGALLSSTKAVTKLQGTGAEWAGGWRCQPAASLISQRRTAKSTVMIATRFFENDDRRVCSVVW